MPTSSSTDRKKSKSKPVSPSTTDKKISCEDNTEAANQNKEANSTLNLEDLSQLTKLILEESDEAVKSNIINQIKKYEADLFKKCDLEYKILYLYHNSMIEDFHANNIYTRLRGEKEKEKEKDVLLIIHSGGGRIEPAYLISKCCKDNAKENFFVAIPRIAKSAATLIALGADGIHMGQMSEIGPIDPQYAGLPALGLSSALETLAKLCRNYRESSSMFAEYLSRVLPLNTLGYFERISESAVQYATILLQNSRLERSKKEIDLIAHRLVYEYKSHSFVIDKDEAKKLLGEKMIQTGTAEYEFGSRIHNFLGRLNMVYMAQKNKYFNLIGSSEDLILEQSR